MFYQLLLITKTMKKYHSNCKYIKINPNTNSLVLNFEQEYDDVDILVRNKALFNFELSEILEDYADGALKFSDNVIHNKSYFALQDLKHYCESKGQTLKEILAEEKSKEQLLNIFSQSLMK